MTSHSGQGQKCKLGAWVLAVDTQDKLGHGYKKKFKIVHWNIQGVSSEKWEHLLAKQKGKID